MAEIETNRDVLQPLLKDLIEELNRLSLTDEEHELARAVTKLLAVYDGRTN